MSLSLRLAARLSEAVMGCTGSCSMGGSRLLNGLFRGSDGESTLVRIGVCLSSPPDDLVGAGWACRLLPAASDVIRSGVKPFGVWCNWQHD